MQSRKTTGHMYVVFKWRGTQFVPSNAFISFRFINYRSGYCYNEILNLVILECIIDSGWWVKWNWSEWKERPSYRCPLCHKSCNWRRNCTWRWCCFTSVSWCCWCHVRKHQVSDTKLSKNTNCKYICKPKFTVLLEGTWISYFNKIIA